MQDITASDLPNADGFLRRAVLRVLAWVQAGLAYLHYGYLDWIARQAVPFTATDEYLEAWAAFAPTPVLREAPVAAQCPTVTFQATTGAPIPAGTLMARTDTTQYRTVAAVTAASNQAVVSILAVVAGAVGNADAGTTLTLATAIAGVVSGSGVAGAPITGGTDLETDASLRTRMLESYASPPAGGSATDYVTWALEVPGVTRAWTLANALGAGTVTLYFMMDKADSAFNGFPQGKSGAAAAETRAPVATGDPLTVANALYPLQPVTALVYAAAPAPAAVNLTLAGLTQSTVSQRAAVSGALTSLFMRRDSPLADTAIEQSDCVAALTAIGGLASFAIAAPASWPLVSPVGALFTLGTVTYL